MAALSFSLETAQENSKVAAVAYARKRNAELIAQYDTNFEAWRTVVLAGKIPNTNPPQPPFAWEPMQNIDGFWYEDTGDDRICQPRTDIPADFSKPQPVTQIEGGQSRNVPPGDKTPIGVIVTAPDGSQWQRQSSSTPWGTAHFYARIS